MHQSATVSLHVDNLVPNAGDNESGWILSVWEGANEQLKDIEFDSEDPYRSALAHYRVSARLEEGVALLRQARDSAGSFSNYLQQAQQPGGPTTRATLHFDFSVTEGNLELYSLYNAIGTFIHQLVLALNIAFPGSCELVGTRYEGENAERFEAPQFNSSLFTNAWLSAFDSEWPQLKPVRFRAVWNWLKARRTSETDVAVTDMNKVLFSLLAVASHRHAISTRDGILVAQMIELLTKVQDRNRNLVRERVVAALGKPGPRGDSFNELYRLKESLMRGDYPVHRPALIVHEADDPILQQLEMHNSPVEQGAAIVMALIQDLVNHEAGEYRFTQQINRE